MVEYDWTVGYNGIKSEEFLLPCPYEKPPYVETTMVTWGSTILAMGDLQDPIYKGGTYLPFPLKKGF